MSQAPTFSPFLKDVARHYLSELRPTEPWTLSAERTFVFPSKRSRDFFLNYLSELSAETGQSFFSPPCCTISEFLSSLHPELEVLDKTALLFRLYECRCRQYERWEREGRLEEGDALETLDEYLFWANIILSDFDLIDRHCIDAYQLYRNVEGLKELEDKDLDYLDEETKEYIKQYFKGFVNTRELSEHDKSIYRRKFLRFWGSLYELYSIFGEQIEASKECYEGYLYRAIADDALNIAVRLEEELGMTDDKPFAPYVFVGLYELSESEMKLMKQLRRRGLAEFCWDTAVYLLHEQQVDKRQKHSSALIMQRNIEELGAVALDRAGAERERAYLPSDIRIYHTASTVTQVKALSSVFEDCGLAIEQRSDDDLSDRQSSTYQIDEARLGRSTKGDQLSRGLTLSKPGRRGYELETAIILPDEQLLVPTVGAIPTEYQSINITLGYPLSHTSVSTLINRWMRMLSTMYKQSLAVPQILSLLSLQLLRDHYPGITHIINYLRKKSEKNYMLSVAWILDKGFAELIDKLQDECERAEVLRARPIIEILLAPSEEAQTFLRQIDRLLELLAEPMREADQAVYREKLIAQMATAEEAERRLLAERLEEDNFALSFELNFLQHYQRLVKRLDSLLSEQRSTPYILSRETLIQLLDGLSRHLTIPFRGNPLQGLQIMGLLESRSLHFKNLVYLTAQEGRLPKRRFGSTFIPSVLRYAYRLPTPEYNDAVDAYRFYQNIAQCERLILLISEEDSLGGKGEESRYIAQLAKLYDCPIERISVDLSPQPTGQSPIVVEKDEETMAKLYSYLSDSPDYGDKLAGALSPSSLNVYLTCPLKFYYSYIKGMREEQEASELIAANDFGTVLHATLGEFVYMSAVGRRLDKPEEYLQRMGFDNRDKLIGLVTEVYRRECKESLDQIDYYYIDLITSYVACVLDYDKSRGAFTYLQSEAQAFMAFPLIVGDEQRYVRFKGSIDRLDILHSEEGDRIRILDYKTGGDKTTDKVATAFRKPSDYKAVIQTLLYTEMLLSGELYPTKREGKKPQSEDYQARLDIGIQATEANVEPGLMLVRKMMSRKDYDSRMLKGSYADVREEFLERITETLTELYSPEQSFRQTEDTRSCEYCTFRTICRR